MALISCPECSNQVSDAAVSCPKCGHPFQAQIGLNVEAKKAENSELFKAGGSNFVLTEIAALSSTKTRNWIYLVIGLPVVVGVIFAWLSLDWPLAVGATIAGMVVLGFIHNDKGIIASTGNVTDIEENMEDVIGRYQLSMSKEKLLKYQGRNTFVDMNFTVNPERVAEFSKASSLSHFGLYALGIVGFVVGAQYNMPALYAVAAAFLVLGFLSRKSALEITGIGGAKMELYTRAGDVESVIQELTQKIESKVK